MDDHVDLDPYIDIRKSMRQSAKNIELFKYRPFLNAAARISVGPTSFIDRSGRIEVVIDATQGPTSFIDSNCCVEFVNDVAQGPESRKVNVVFVRPPAPEENVVYRPESPERIPGYFDNLLEERFKRRDQAVSPRRVSFLIG